MKSKVTTQKLANLEPSLRSFLRRKLNVKKITLGQLRTRNFRTLKLLRKPNS